MCSTFSLYDYSHHDYYPVISDQELMEKTKEREKAAMLELESINKQLLMKDEVVNEQLSTISRKDDQLAAQEMELVKAKEDITEVNQQKASLEVEKQLLESALVTLQEKLAATEGERSANEESLRSSLFASKLEAKQAAEKLKVMKKNHLQLLKDKTGEKRISMMKRASRDLVVMDMDR